MKQVIAMILTVALIACAGAAWAQQAPATPQGQQPQMGPKMVCPCMMMKMSQMTPEQQKQMQGWWQACPMWQTMPQQPPAQPQPKK